MAADASLPYREPGIVVILVLTSFLLLLAVVNAAVDKLLYCGLLGQVLIGIAWGSPGAKWLSASAEETVVQLGYLGLVLLVYEGLSRVIISRASDVSGHCCEAVTTVFARRKERPRNVADDHQVGWELHSSLSKPISLSHPASLSLALLSLSVSHTRFKDCSMPPQCRLSRQVLHCAPPAWEPRSQC
jgi:hypothetical protein